jgi:DNA repair protein RadC
MVECGEMMGIEILDHFIIGVDEYLSLREYGII